MHLAGLFAVPKKKPDHLLWKPYLNFVQTRAILSPRLMITLPLLSRSSTGSQCLGHSTHLSLLI